MQFNFKTYEEYEKYLKNQRRLDSFAFFILLTTIVTILFFTGKAGANCQDPSTLSPELKKAYYESLKMCQQVGCTLSIRCYQNGGTTH